MFANIISYLEKLFDINYYNKEKDKKIMDENLWVLNELEKWKLEMYSQNNNLSYIPQSRIIKKKNELIKEYKKFKI